MKIKRIAIHTCLSLSPTKFYQSHKIMQHAKEMYRHITLFLAQLGINKQVPYCLF